MTLIKNSQCAKTTVPLARKLGGKNSANASLADLYHFLNAINVHLDG